MAHQLAGVFLAVKQLAAHLVTVNRRRVRTAAHGLSTRYARLVQVLGLPALARQLDNH